IIRHFNLNCVRVARQQVEIEYLAEAAIAGLLTMHLGDVSSIHTTWDVDGSLAIDAYAHRGNVRTGSHGESPAGNCTNTADLLVRRRILQHDHDVLPTCTREQGNKGNQEKKRTTRLFHNVSANDASGCPEESSLHFSPVKI